MGINITKIANNLTKIDTNKNGIFFMSYNTPIAYIKGKKELITITKYSTTTTNHVRKLKGAHIRRSAEEVREDVLVHLCKEAGIDCDY